MPISPEKLTRVQQFGLSEYEGRAYLALLELGEATASQCARASRVPRTKIYQALEGLEFKRLVRVLPERPKRYAAESMEQYLKQVEAEFQRKAGDLAAQRAAVVAEFIPRGGLMLMDPGSTVMLRGRANVTERLLNLIERATSHVTLLCSANGLQRFQQFADAFRDARGRGVSVTVIAPILASNAAAAASLQRVGTVMAYDAVPAGHVLLVVDGREALVSHAQPDDTHLYQGEDTGLWTSDGSMVHAFEAHLDLVAKHARDPPAAVTPATSHA